MIKDSKSYCPLISLNLFELNRISVTGQAGHALMRRHVCLETIKSKQNGLVIWNYTL